MAKTVSTPDSPPDWAKTMRARAKRFGTEISILALTLPIAAGARAQETPQASGNRHFTAAPAPKSVEDEAAATDVILGIPVNTIFFVAVAVIAVLWFTLGGGRKAKLGRPQ